MSHISEHSRPLIIEQVHVEDPYTIPQKISGLGDVCVVILPASKSVEDYRPLLGIEPLFSRISEKLDTGATLIAIGEVVDLVHVHSAVSEYLQYQLWISIKRQQPRIALSKRNLSQSHFGALVHTKYSGSLRHTKTRIEYTYCPACGKTTKDYGGNKHTYNHYGTLVSDVWRDIPCDLDGDLAAIIARFADLFGIASYQRLSMFDCRSSYIDRVPQRNLELSNPIKNDRLLPKEKLILGDCLEKLSEIPDNSVDFVFVDPPYNVGKNYTGYSDDLTITRYFEWCDEWLIELARVLKWGRTCAILNIPIRAIRHFLHLEKLLQFQNWISWDALAYPVRFIMPAHYAILCFSKGVSRELPCFAGRSGEFDIPNSSRTFYPLKPLAEWFCRRASCVNRRQDQGIDDRGILTDVWWDIHRLKHNSRRVDHPCQLPPQLMYRLISIFTEPGEVVLDCFNGAGTSTLTAAQLKRNYMGIEVSSKYHDITVERHRELESGLDPFRKADRNLSEKNSPVRRVGKQKYEVPKKVLQLEVRRVANLLNKIPNRSEMEEYGRYPVRYYDEYFASWGEACAAVRHNGMSETRAGQPTLFDLPTK